MLNPNNSTGYDIFLGGTATDNGEWRKYFIDKLKEKGSKLICFNPIVSDWNTEAIYLENVIKKMCKYHIYVITPQIKGVYSIAEAVESAMNNSHETYFCFVGKDEEWDQQLKHSLDAVANLLLSHGAQQSKSIDEMIDKIIESKKTTPTIRSL